MQNNTHRKTRPQPSKWQLFTGGKSAQLAIFNNMAFFRVAGLLNHLLGKPYTEDKNSLEKVFKDWLYSKPHLDAKHERVFHKLRDYLWKGYRANQNSSGHILTDQDRNLVKDMLATLEQVRNFHSHIWHDNVVLRTSPELARHVEKLHEMAKLSLMGKYAREVEAYEENFKKFPLFKTHDSADYFTPEGRLFFLSFFLTSGEMTRILKQSRGSKRDDMPEYKVKHLVFKYYAHRDGAARQHYGHSDDAISQMHPNERSNILNARQAYKIISYLNDLPQLCSDPDVFPLYFDGKPVQNASDMIAFCEANKLLEGLKMMVLVIPEKVNKAGEKLPELTKEQILDIQFGAYHIHLSKHTLHRLLLDRVLFDHLDTTSLLREKSEVAVEDHEKAKDNKKHDLFSLFQSFVDEREHLYQLVTSKDYRDVMAENGRITLNDELDQYYRFKLRGNDGLRKKMGKWLEKIETDKDGSYEEKMKTFEEAIRSEPIEVDYYDFFFEADEKPRATNHFVRYAVQYLMDMGKTPQWHWACERFEVEIVEKQAELFGKTVATKVAVNKRRVAYFANLPEPISDESKYRLAINKDNQVLVGIYTNEPEEYRKSGAAPKFKFLLGHRALKNLLIADLEGKSIDHFFSPLISDLNKISKGNSDLKLISPKELPQSFRIAMGNQEKPGLAELRAEAHTRIDAVLAELLPFKLDDYQHLRLSRAEKNRQIMRCYRYFDWKYASQQEYKFLRQQEYNRMSVFHYCLEKPNVREYTFLIEDIRKHLPMELEQILKKAKDLDELLVKVSEATCLLLQDWKDKLPITRGEALQARLGKLGISMRQHHNLPPDTLPFDVHPILPLRAYYKEELNKGKFSASKSLRESSALQNGLRSAYYQYQAYSASYNTGPNAVKVHKRLVGDRNELLTQDILLLQIARQYLDKTSAAYRAFLTGNAHNVDWQVQNLRNTKIELPMDKEYTGYPTVSLQIKFHQLDDYLLVESIPYIARAAGQAIRRFQSEKALTNMGIKETVAGLAYSITYDEVFKEIQRIRNESLHWAEHLLEWERGILSRMDEGTRDQLANGKQPKGRPHIKFKEVLDAANILDNVLRDKLKTVRNTTFHAGIPQASNPHDTEANCFPQGWSYWELEQDAVLCNCIGYSPKMRIDYTV